MSTPATTTYELRKGLWGRKRKLVLAPDVVVYENKDLQADPFSRVAAADITDIKHRTRWVVWYRFYVGRVYEISIRYQDKAELRITFNSYFGLRAGYMDVYANIIETFWALYFQKVVDGYLQTFHEGHEIVISGVRLSAEGVYFSAQHGVVPWKDLAYAEYYDYFALYQADRAKMNVRRDFYAWESEILLSLIRTIKQERVTDI